MYHSIPENLAKAVALLPTPCCEVFNLHNVCTGSYVFTIFQGGKISDITTQESRGTCGIIRNPSVIVKMSHLLCCNCDFRALGGHVTSQAPSLSPLMNQGITTSTAITLPLPSQLSNYKGGMENM